MTIEEDGGLLKIEFFWNDLNKNAQEELIGVLGDNCNWDVVPFYTLEVEIDCEK